MTSHGGQPLAVLRPVTADDISTIYEWVNDPDVRANSFTSDPISWDDHAAWWNRFTADPAARMWILEVDGTPVGQFRTTVDEHRGELGYLVAPEHRGQGHAALLLRLGVAAFRTQFPRVPLYARVKPDNDRSRAALRTAGWYYQPGSDTFLAPKG